jgi:hypothetical protein
VILVADPQRAETTLAAGELPCPYCGGVLRAWAYGRTRRVRGLPDPVRPRRTKCASCDRTHILLPGDLLPRRADATAVVGTALIAKAGGRGHRRIAADLHRPVSTVRRWLRAARNPAHLERIRRWANQRTFRIDPDTLNRIVPAGGMLGDALTALAANVDAVRRCHPDITAGDWALIGVLTRGRLLHPAPSG